MSEVLLHLLTSAHGALAYSLIFGVLVACGFGLPLPEDVALVTGGYLSFIGAANLWLMLFTALLGILGGDLLVYAAGHRYGHRIAHTHWLHRFLTDDKIAKVQSYFARYGKGLVFIARFLPGLRVVTYFSAGASEFGAWRFLLFDALAACISAPLWILTGRRLGRHFHNALFWVSRTHWVLVGVAGFLGLLLLIFVLRRNGSSAATGRKSSPSLVPPKPAPPQERTGSAG